MKILLIEDEPDVRQTLQDILTVNGHTTLAAENGREGIRLASTSPDLIFCDIAMPGLDGYDVLTHLKGSTDTRDIPFVFLTARVDRSDQRRGMTLGADDYLTKPFSEREILEILNTRVNRHRTLREKIEHLLEERRCVVGADWSHELMTPLAGVLGGLHLIECEVDEIDREELKKLLALIRAGAERQERLSLKLVRHFDLEQVKSGLRPPLNHGTAHEGTVAEASLKMARSARRETDLRLRLANGLLRVPSVYLHDAVGMVVENAFQFSLAGTPVEVTGRLRDAVYRIEVVDRGPGLTAEERASIRAFRQFHTARLAQPGLGLGLAIARSVAELAGGRFNLESPDEGPGLKAVFELPCY